MTKAILLLLAALTAQAAEVTIAGTLYHPVNATRANCTITIAGPVRSGASVGASAGATELIPTVRTVRVVDGVYSFSIQPNSVMLPLTTQYRALYACTAGQTSYSEQWYVLSSAGQTIGSIRIIPTSAFSMRLTWENAHISWSEI